jgi:hypothetical protein
MTDNIELESLRVSLARIAQKLGLHDEIPGNPGFEAPFEALCKAARDHERGWNRLAACIADEVERLQAKAFKYDDMQE